MATRSASGWKLSKKDQADVRAEVDKARQGLSESGLTKEDIDQQMDELTAKLEKEAKEAKKRLARTSRSLPRTARRPSPLVRGVQPPRPAHLRVPLTLLHHRGALLAKPAPRTSTT